MALSWQMGKAQDKAEQRETVQEKAWTSSITHTLLGDTFLLFTLPQPYVCRDMPQFRRPLLREYQFQGRKCSLGVKDEGSRPNSLLTRPVNVGRAHMSGAGTVPPAHCVPCGLGHLLLKGSQGTVPWTLPSPSPHWPSVSSFI